LRGSLIDEVAGVAEAEMLKVTAWLAPAARENDEEGEGATPGGTLPVGCQ